MGPIPTHRFRIYVGYPDSQLVLDPRLIIQATDRLLQIAGIDNFTRYIETGFWNGKKETAIIFEIISSSAHMPLRVSRAAALLKDMPEGEQEAVLVTTDLIESYVI